MTFSTGPSQHRQLPPNTRQAVDPRLESWPVIHCELCGTVAIAARPSTQFCIRCGLYICAGCWRPAVSRCSNCALSAARPSMRQHIWTLRRADRRLREVVADLNESDDDAEQGWDRRAQAIVKVDASLRAREVALAHLPRARHQPRVAALLRRVERDAAAARAAIERPRERQLPARAAAEIPGLPRGWYQRIVWIAAGATAAVVALSLGLSVIARERGIAEGVLSGGPQESAAPSPSSARAEARGMDTPASPIRNSVAVFDFDDRQMGSGLGPGWRDAGEGEIGLAAFPTGVDRSARLIADGTTPVRTCRTFDAGARAVAIDVFLDRLVPAVARVELSGSPDAAIVAIDLSESTTTVSIAGDVIKEEGIQPASWAHVEIRSDGGGVAWQITQGTNDPGRSVQGRTSGPTTEGLTEVCLGVEATAGGRAHYDNLTIQRTSSDGG